MGHCVASYFDTSSSSIYSLRDSKNMSHCTLEITEDADFMNQCKGKGNGKIHHRYIDYVLKSFEFFGIKIRETELSSLGYFRPECVGASNEQVAWFIDNFGHLPTYCFNNKRFFYVG
jgi:hypothetical protein